MTTETKPKASEAGTGKGICHFRANSLDDFPPLALCGKVLNGKRKKTDGHGAHCNVCVVCADLADYPHPGYTS